MHSTTNFKGRAWGHSSPTGVTVTVVGRGVLHPTLPRRGWLNAPQRVNRAQLASGVTLKIVVRQLIPVDTDQQAVELSARRRRRLDRRRAFDVDVDAATVHV